MVVLGYLVPLGLTAAFLVSRGLDVLAVGLLAVEAFVATAVTLSLRTPRTPRPPKGPTDGSTFLLVLGGGLVAAVVVVLVLVRLTAR